MYQVGVPRESITYSNNKQSMKELGFQLNGSCQCVDVFLNARRNYYSGAQSGRLTGTWQWRFDNGTVGSTYVSGATTSQMTPEGESLVGIIKISMFSLDGSPSDSNLLFLSYESTALHIEDNKVSISIEGSFTGGTGDYTDAEGSLALTSVNGLIQEGSGTLILGDSD